MYRVKSGILLRAMDGIGAHFLIKTEEWVGRSGNAVVMGSQGKI